MFAAVLPLSGKDCATIMGWAKEGGVFLCVLSYAFHRFPFPLGPVGASFRSVRRKMQANPSGFWLKFNGYLWVEYFYSTRGSASPGLCGREMEKNV